MKMTQEQIHKLEFTDQEFRALSAFLAGWTERKFKNAIEAIQKDFPVAYGFPRLKSNEGARFLKELQKTMIIHLNVDMTMDSSPGEGPGYES